MNGTDIRTALRAGRCVFGTHITSFLNPNATAITTEIDLDFAFFCTEHMPLDRTEVSLLCRFFAARGISPVVRVPSADAVSDIGMMLDGGAEGIVVPYVESVEQVRQAYGAVKYRPIKGKLLTDMLDAPAELPEKTREFLARFNRHNHLIIGIESVAAIENLDRLLDAADVDGVFLGPHDISASMGIPEEYENPVFLETVEMVIRRCRQRGVGVGLHTLLIKLGEPTLRRLFAAGMNWIINGSDVTVMRDAMNAQIRKLREIAGEAPVDSPVALPEYQSCLN